MNLYKWKSKYLEVYKKGDIIVMAESVEFARDSARQAFMAHVNDRYDYLDTNDPNDAGMLETYRLMFERDIGVEPEVIEKGVVLVAGSE